MLRVMLIEAPAGRLAMTCRVMGINSAYNPWFEPELTVFQLLTGSPVPLVG